LKNVVIIGGGLAGLITGIQLARAGVPCRLIEKKSYPFHRVCGEYISNEAVPFLRSHGLYPDEFAPPQINQFQLSAVTGRQAMMPLALGGFGISRFVFDQFLSEKAKQSGVEFLLGEEVTAVHFDNGKFHLQTQSKKIETDLVIGAYGKRSKLDNTLQRDFIKKRSPYVGIKYHIRTQHPDHLIALHNFEGGYCGISNVESGKTNLCYLTHRSNLRKFGDVETMEEHILHKNPLLKSIFVNSEFILAKPEVINEISFETKAPVCNNMLMAGDAAGMITPLCGNGMAMAIHSAKIASALAVDFCSNKISRSNMENQYNLQWKNQFANRLWKGREMQRLFGNSVVSNVAVNLALYFRPVANLLVRNTHGEIF
jgi:flavin-dependent dehydrogenase